jgi:hypothetical protein
MPERVKTRLVGWLRESIRDVVKTGNRQIRATKRALDRPEAKGVRLIANDNNYGFSPDAMMKIIGDAAARLTDNHVDGIVYFTPNVFHRKQDSDVAWTIWDTRYRDETDESLSEFVNELGRKWNDFEEIETGDRFIAREEIPNVEVSQRALSEMHPVRRLGRPKKP